MEVSGKTIKFSNTLWVQHGGVRVKNEKDTVLVEGVDDESYLKIFNHFGRVLRLYSFEEGQWVDSATGATPTTLDESLAGQVPATKHASSAKPAARSVRAKSAGKAAGTVKATPKSTAKPAAAKKTGAGAAARAKSAGKKKAVAKSATAKKAGAGKDQGQ